jgi:hypothetical protein
MRRRRSRCGGTKHKITATSTKAACIAESFLTIYLRIECDPCQHKAWEAAWKLKLVRANAFLTELRQRDLPGVDTVATLVQSLEAEYITASWNTRTMFAHGPKPSITRVKHSWYEKAASKLPQELRPEDIVEKNAKEWTEMDDEDYDGNYEASTDPVHPVSTDYSHPLDDDDGAWILQHLSEEDVAGTQEDIGFDFNDGHGWNWGEDNNDLDALQTTEQWDEDQTKLDEQETCMRSSQGVGASVMAGAPEAEPSCSTDMASINTRHVAEAEQQAKVDRIIVTFWSIVNHNDQHTGPQTPPTMPGLDTDSLASALDSIRLSECEPCSALESTMPPPERTVWTDGSSDHLLTSPPPKPELPSLPPRPTTPPSPNSTRAWYDKQRKILRLRQETDITKYYSDWLYISRCEIRDFEGPDGNMIREPLKIQG